MKLNIFLLMCLSGVISISLQAVRRDYYLITTPATWTNAQTYCRQNYEDLAAMETEDDWQRLNAWAASKGLPTTGWVGLYRNSWSWVSYSSSVDLTFWAPGQPDNAGMNQECVAIASNGYWYDYSCTDLKPIICYDANSKAFVGYNNTPTDFTGGYNYCLEKNENFAKVTNELENEQLQQLAVYQNTSWIGLRRDPWTWCDSTLVSSLRWSPGSPNNVDLSNKCALVNNSLLLDRPCNNEFYFFCQAKYKVRSQVMKLNIQGDKSVFDPAVQSAILQQIVQKLKNRGVAVETTVTWRVQPDGNIFHLKSNDVL